MGEHHPCASAREIPGQERCPAAGRLPGGWTSCPISECGENPSRTYGRVVQHPNGYLYGVRRFASALLTPRCAAAHGRFLSSIIASIANAQQALVGVMSTSKGTLYAVEPSPETPARWLKIGDRVDGFFCPSIGPMTECLC